MDAGTLFLETLAELDGRTTAGSSEYDLVRAALLLRQLLMDGRPLVDQVNRGHRLDIQYTVGRTPAYTKLVMEDGPTFYARADGLDPDTALRSAVSVPLKRDDFLREFVLLSNGFEMNVREVIAYLAHVEGGVHSGVPKDDKERELRAVTLDIALGGLPPAAQSVRAIARVVSRALQPLRAAVEGAQRLLHRGVSPTLPRAGLLPRPRVSPRTEAA